MGKHLKIIEKRIIKNFKKNIYIKESFMLLDEMCGRSKKIFRLGTLLDIFSRIDYIKYKKEILNILSLQLFFVSFNKKRKFKKEYKLYTYFKKEYVTFDKEDFENYKIKTDSLLYIFYQALIYTCGKNIFEKLWRIDNLLFILEKDSIMEIKDFLESSTAGLNTLIKRQSCSPI